jgi:hypothetical protein
MGGKGELVKYTSLIQKGPLTPGDKKKLKEKINAIIDAASGSITIQAMVEPTVDDLKKALKKKEE